MAEHIDSQDLLSSGSHRWNWGDKARVSKRLRTVGAMGDVSYRVAVGGRPVVIAGLLRGSGASLSAAKLELDAIEKAIETLIDAGSEVSWEDLDARSGTGLVLAAYRRRGRRELYAADKEAWQRYQLLGRENSGSIFA